MCQHFFVLLKMMLRSPIENVGTGQVVLHFPYFVLHCLALLGLQVLCQIRLVSQFERLHRPHPNQ